MQVIHKLAVPMGASKGKVKWGDTEIGFNYESAEEVAAREKKHQIDSLRDQYGVARQSPESAANEGKWIGRVTGGLLGGTIGGGVGALTTKPVIGGVIGGVLGAVGLGYLLGKGLESEGRAAPGVASRDIGEIAEGWHSQDKDVVNLAKKFRKNLKKK